MRPRISAYRKTASGSAAHKAYLARNTDKVKGWTAKHRAKKRDKYNQLKSGPCVDCGITYPPYVMHFDHLDASTKLSCVGHIKACGLDRIKREIAKCELVCANCHAERTYKRAQQKKDGRHAKLSTARFAARDI